MSDEIISITILPATAACRALSEYLPEEHWRELSDEVLKASQGNCEWCGSEQELFMVERWEFEDARSIQRLETLLALCAECKMITLIGQPEAREKVTEALAHLRDINGWTPQEASAHLRQSIHLYNQRNNQSWKLDLSLIGEEPVVAEEEEDALELGPNQIALPLPELHEWMAALYELEAGQIGPATRQIVTRTLAANLPKEEVGSFLKELANEARKIRKTLRQTVPTKTVKWNDHDLETTPPDEALALYWEYDNDEPGLATANCEARWHELSSEEKEDCRDEMLEMAESACLLWEQANKRERWIVEMIADSDEEDGDDAEDEDE